MDNATRRTRFEHRISIEREYLGPINLVFGKVAPLAGMTAEAIKSWRGRARDFCDAGRIDSITAILLEASKRAELLADNSKDVFEPQQRPRPESLGELLQELKRALSETAFCKQAN